MIPKIGRMFFMTTSCVLLTLGCQQRAENVTEPKPLSKAEAAKFREVTIGVTGMS